MVHQLDNEVVLAENIDELGGGRPRFVEFTFQQKLRDDGRQAAGETDQALAVFCQCFQVGARVAVKALGVCLGDDLAEVLVAGEIARQ